MAGRKKKFEFTTILSPIDVVFMKTAIFLPQEILHELPKGRVRTQGTMNGVPFSLAVQYRQKAGWYFSVGAPLRKAAALKVGDKVTVCFHVVAPDVLKVPQELQAVLQQDPAAFEAWEKFTTGYQRGLIHYVTSVKNVDSRIKRALQMMEKAKAGRLHGQKKK